MAAAEEAARGGLEWLASTGRAGDDGELVWGTRPSEVEVNPMLYNGGAGIVIAFLEGYAHFGDERYAEVARRGALGLRRAVHDGWEYSSLYFGLAGIAFALRAVDRVLGDGESGRAADRAWDLVRQRFDGESWGPQLDLLGGNAGIALAALADGDAELAVRAVEPFVRSAESTPHGVTWETRTGRPARLHHLSHGTLGVVGALAAVAHATGRTDMRALAEAGAADVLARNEAGPDGLLVPHSDPQDQPDLVERHSYGWCNGPAGDAQVFRLLRSTAPPQEAAVWAELTERCWRTVTASGLPQRLRPGFWDNNGRCCGTAGVLALALDRHEEQGGDLHFADVLVTDLLARATRDATGVRWSNTEHRAVPPELEPATGWAMGNAGIVRELLRYTRTTAYAVPWPDQPAPL
ncbi:lanthionine synthetase LanC family protein [Actinacidiphila guanduensis]|uniref:Lanthionine synthetase C-like protein n=1 Tax=Actinacidiphila guanduensis TaxID=310781 RepID=A0A1H0FEQ7_9ACTN|nr:lanthionine synthetase LanC family protein [Actinacidiphila guanduensis]SDN93042.1 Lanthionine synthetase C-like protein [Actinacidiphila guanduensis]